MARELIINEILDSGMKEIGRLKGQSVPIGRECPDGITIASQGISRNHGIFIQAKNHWIYKDTGSTNGSWINGEKLHADTIRIVRPGDSIQIGDAALRLVEVPASISSSQAGFSVKTPQSVLVFEDNNVLDEFPMPEFGRALVVGGSGADLSIDGDLDEQPSLILEKRGDVVCAFRISKNAEVTLNGTHLTERTNIKDGDRLIIGKYLIVLNDPPVKVHSDPVSQPGVAHDAGSSSDWMDSSSFKKGVVKSSFGQSQVRDTDEIEETVAFNVSEPTTRGYDRRSAMGFDESHPMSGAWNGPGALEDKLVLLLGAFFLMALVLVVVWWLLK